MTAAIIWIGGGRMPRGTNTLKIRLSCYSKENLRSKWYFFSFSDFAVDFLCSSNIRYDGIMDDSNNIYEWANPDDGV